MAVEFRLVSIPHEPATGADPTPSAAKAVTFFGNVDNFQCAIAGFELSFIGSGAEHPLQSERIKIVAQRRSAVSKIVDVRVVVGLKDGSGNYDDRYRGTVDVVVIADTSADLVLRNPVLGGRMVALRASNGLFLSAGAANGKLAATRTIAGDTERFRVELLDDTDAGPVRDRSAVALRASNGKIVCADNGGGGALVANRDQIGPWETFTLRRIGDAQADGTPLYSDDRVALRAAKGDFVRAEPAGTDHPVLADRPRIGSDEIYTVVVF